MVVRFIIIFLLVPVLDSFSQSLRDLSFVRLNTNQGLSHNQVNSIYQDEQGFIWIGTLAGLNRFDGYRFTTFYYDEKDPVNSLKSNAIIWMADGPERTIWISTGEGISIYSPRTQAFVVPDDPLLKVISQLNVVKIVRETESLYWVLIGDGTLMRIALEGSSWVESTAGGQSNISDIRISSRYIWTINVLGQVIRVDKTNGDLNRFYVGDQIKESRRQEYSLFIDGDEHCWIYSRDHPFGLLFLDTGNGKTRLFDEQVITSPVITTLMVIDSQTLWVGTDHGGIAILNTTTFEVQKIASNPDRPGGLIQNSITALLKDHNGIIWVGTTKSGLCYHSPIANNFKYYRYPSKDPSFNDMSSLAEDNQGNLWIGTNGKGLLKFDLTSNRFSQVSGMDDSGVIVSLEYTHKDELLIGTYLDGLYTYHEGNMNHYTVDEWGLSDDNIWKIYEDPKGRIWLGTLRNGIDRWSPDSNTFSNLDMTNGLVGNYVTDILLDHKNQLWVGTGAGISICIPDSLKVSGYYQSNNQPHSISNNSITSIFEDSRGNIYIGTMGGLNIYTEESGGFKVINQTDGMNSNIVMAILEDDQHHLWVSTNKGINKLSFQGEGVKVQSFDESDGLQGDSFCERGALKLRDGRMAFVGKNGLNIFNPNEILTNDQTPPIVFTHFYIANERVVPGEEVDNRTILHEGLNFTEKIALAHDENSFAFEFTTLTFFQAHKNRYQYQLVGFDETWVNVPAEVRRANYTNLDPGSYIFKVRASNNHNRWSEGRAIYIHIATPFWETPLAILLYAVTLTIVLLVTRRNIINRERFRARIAGERLEAQRMHEIDLMKIKFFTNISHEFRTPLSLIITPIERMLKSLEQVKKNDLVLVHRNAKRLLTLVNQLLDFRKMEVNQHQIILSRGDLVLFVQNVTESFSDLSRDRDINLSFESEMTELFVQFDKDKLEKILFNLLSNAFKFTLPGGKIIVDLEEVKREENIHTISLAVTDTGIGIPEQAQSSIFKRFFQSSTSDQVLNQGTGIGLSITKEFVELQGGTITFESKEGIGTSFMVEIPFKSIQVVEAENTGNLPATYHRDGFVSSHEYSIFLVEDNADFRFYLKDNLNQFYNVRDAGNGKEAWKSIVHDPPDMVITDLMMPVMGGLELCKKIKNDPRTSAIPIILLTAKSSDQHAIEGLEAGAIEFITKPFNFEILLSTINSALRFQQRVERNLEKIEVAPHEISIVSLDEQLVKKALQIVEDNMSNSEFSVEDLSHELGYSRGHLYQKMLKITGQSPMDFIRKIRLKRAIELLEKSQLSVSQVAYMVGYNNPKLFSRYFKSQYKVYPSEYIALHNRKHA